VRPVRDKLRAEGSDLEDLDAAEKEQALDPHVAGYFISMTSDIAKGSYVDPGKAFDRDMNYIPDRITRDARDGWPVEAGRYRLIVARACPWANRSIIVRRLLGLEDAISIGYCGPTHDERSWTFDLDPGGVDPVLGIERLQQAYFERFPDYSRGITVPAIVDVPTGQVVTNDFPVDHA
jgi:putative glutathione S-transferase